MKRIINIILSIAAVSVVAACNEFEPVFTGQYQGPENEKLYTEEDFAGKKFISILELKNRYVDGPVKIEDDVYIKGQVTSSDASGNFYRGVYIQDGQEGAGIELKIGKTGLYNFYKVGQWIYVKCQGLTLGDYEGSKQLGYEDLTGQYETIYLEVQTIIDQHIFKGEKDTPLKPSVLSLEDLKKPENLGRYVTLNNVKFGNKKGGHEIFCMLYVDPDKNHKDQANRIFLDEENPKGWNINSWAMSKNKFWENLQKGYFDKATIASDESYTVKKAREEGKIKSQACTVNQVFTMDEGNSKNAVPIAVRTSGYAKFADLEMDLKVGDRVNLTGILTIYREDIQFTLIDINGVEKIK